MQVRFTCHIDDAAWLADSKWNDQHLKQAAVSHLDLFPDARAGLLPTDSPGHACRGTAKWLSSTGGSLERGLAKEARSR